MTYKPLRIGLVFAGLLSLSAAAFAAGTSPGPLVEKAYQTLRFKKESMFKLVFSPVEQANFDKYKGDRELSPFLDLAKEEKDDAVVFVVPMTQWQEWRVVFFKAGVPVSYATGGIPNKPAKLDVIRKTLTKLPEDMKAAAGDPVAYSPTDVTADDGTKLPSFKVEVESN